MLQQPRRLLQQVDIDQPLHQTLDHHVALGARRRELAELLEQRQRRHRRKSVGAAVDIKLLEMAAHRLGNLVRAIDVLEKGHRLSQPDQTFSNVVLGNVHFTETAEQIELEIAATPSEG